MLDFLSLGEYGSAMTETEQATTQRVAANVRAEMARRQINQTDLAARLGRSQAWISRRLVGAVPFDVAELDSIAAILETSITVLVREVAA